MIYWLYERKLLSDLHELPGQICFMISAGDFAAAPGKLADCTGWCSALSQEVARRNPGGENTRIHGLTFHISTASPSIIEPFLPSLRTIGQIARLTLDVCGRRENIGTGLPVTVAIGRSGREEIVEAIRMMAREHVDPELIDESAIESRLTFRYAPDLVIKAGGDHLTDFLIWQSVYSELFFLDVNWSSFRKVDFLRALRDYQSRSRRFGA